MPTYEYECEDCGRFEAIQRVSARNDAPMCPACGGAGRRVILTAPAVATMSGALRGAHSTNERARNEPILGAKHRAGCTCCASTKTPAVAVKGFPKKRPWMLSH